MVIIEAIQRIFGREPEPEPMHHQRETHEIINLCLVKVMTSGLSTTTHHTIHRSYLQSFCDQAAEDDGVKEATVYQEVFHHRHPDSDEPIDPAALVPAIGSFAMRAKPV